MIHVGDCRDVLATLPERSVQMVCTSPPYYGLRDYGVDGQLGLEGTLDEYVERMVQVFRAARRVLRDDGTIWLNLGDGFASSPPGNVRGVGETSGLHGAVLSDAYRETLMAGHATKRDTTRATPSAKPKDLLGVPWAVAFALRADGWYLRSAIVWHKTAPMPESVRDRPTQAHEFVFLLAKRPVYFYDAEAVREQSVSDHPSGNGYARPERATYANADGSPRGQVAGWVDVGGSRNKRSVWTLGPEPYAGAHFAVMPTKLVEPCVLAGSAPKACGECGTPWRRMVEAGTVTDHGGSRKRADAPGAEVSPTSVFRTGKIATVRTVGWEASCSHDDRHGRSLVLDPFAGSGTVGVVCGWHGREFVGVELNAEYAQMARDRIAVEGKPGGVKRDRERVEPIPGQIALLDGEAA